MRTFILVFMMLLLPVRGWSGDMMAIEMTGMASATQKVAAHDLNTGASALLAHRKQVFDQVLPMPDCHDPVAALTDMNKPASQAVGNTTDNETGSEHCGTCQSCQACHSVALSPTQPADVSSFTSPQLRPAPTAAFTSAAAALGQKPPIA